MISVNHNLVTSEGDALIVDQLVTTSTQVAIDNANTVIGVGTGFTSVTKSTDALVTQTGSNETMDATYPKHKGAFLSADAGVIQFRSTFEAGDLNVTGLDEACIGHETVTLAYSQLTPTAHLPNYDTCKFDSELTL